ncbi:MAG: DUF3788 domain-containing protein [Acidobacteria bacterium]|jgi:hypothetical protein|nr:DUF3788 domain-containing protein [Acidobacteriota bacterium]
MLRPSLNDPKQFPNDQVLAGQLGKAKPAWIAFLALLKEKAPQLGSEWRYYNDGKSWLFKVSRQATAICWVAVWDKYFSVAFYLNARAEDLVRNSSLDLVLKREFLHPVEANKFRSIRVEVRTKSDLNAVEELLDIKLKVK